MKIISKTVVVTSLVISFNEEEVRDLVPILKNGQDSGVWTAQQRHTIIELLTHFQQIPGKV